MSKPHAPARSSPPTATSPLEATCNGSVYKHASGAGVMPFEARAEDCRGCALRHRCLKNPVSGKWHNVSLFGRALDDGNGTSRKMPQAIDSAQGWRIATVEPVFDNVSRHRGMRRFTLRGKTKIASQWQLYCLVHNIEKIATTATRGG